MGARKLSPVPCKLSVGSSPDATRAIRLSLRSNSRGNSSVSANCRTFKGALATALDWSSALEWSTVVSSPSTNEFRIRRAVPDSTLYARTLFTRQNLKSSKKLSARIKSSLEQKVAMAFALALASVIALGVMQYRAARRLADDLRWVSHTQDILRKLAITRNRLSRADAAAQSFAITGDHRYIATYDEATADIRGNLANLRKL